VIVFENVSLAYVVPREMIGSLKEYTIRRLKRQIQFDRFQALRDITFRIDVGQNLGIIGPNGAGKSTLCKLIARVLRPSKGRVVVDGRVSPLLELGLGMNGELTGVENVYLQGALLGFSRRDMKRRLPGIVDFSELGDFINAPMRTYSSGMAARLAFAVATDVEPDILLVDEALAVGDEQFKAKCAARMKAFREAGTTVVLVSHSLADIRTNCRRAIWLHHGAMMRDGDVEEVTDAYHEWAMGKAPEEARAPESETAPPPA
jgi:ABC-type polysaccharide/polyol phosphate transport system ATPase subunit